MAARACPWQWCLQAAGGRMCVRSDRAALLGPHSARARVCLDNIRLFRLHSYMINVLGRSMMGCAGYARLFAAMAKAWRPAPQARVAARGLGQRLSVPACCPVTRCSLQ